MNTVWILMHCVDYEGDSILDVFADETRGVAELMETVTGRASTPPPAPNEDGWYFVPTPGGGYALSPYPITGA